MFALDKHYQLSTAKDYIPLSGYTSGAGFMKLS